MPSSDAGDAFVPLGGDAPAARELFRPFGAVEAHAEEETAPAPDPAAEEAARARAAGAEAGRAEARAELADVARALGEAAAALAALRERLGERCQRELLSLALDVAERIVGEALAAEPERWLDMIRRAAREVVDRERVVVRASPRVAAVLRADAPALAAALGDPKAVVLVEDATLPEHGCVVESRSGDVDLGVETQVGEIARALACKSE
jgi:flagellar assembly protein FliH